MDKKGVQQPYWTLHARSRAAARFPEVDLDAALNEAARPGKGIRKKIAKQCPVTAQRMLKADVELKGRYWLVNSPQRIVFVIHPPGAVITVFSLGQRHDDAATAVAPWLLDHAAEPPGLSSELEPVARKPHELAGCLAPAVRKRRRFLPPAQNDPLALAPRSQK